MEKSDIFYVTFPVKRRILKGYDLQPLSRKKDDLMIPINYTKIRFLIGVFRGGGGLPGL
jgi:hypothetical protein